MNSISANREMQKDSNLRKEDVRLLEEWCKKQCHLPKMESNELLLFLHSNYYQVDASKINIDRFFTMRTDLPEFFSNRDPLSQEMRNIFNTVTILPLDKCTKEGYRIILAKLIDTNPKNYVYNDAVKYLNMVLDLCVYENGTNNGYVFVFDLDNTTLQHITALSYTGLKNFFEYSLKGAPVRWKGLHYMNSNPTVQTIQDLIKSKIINNKFVDALYFHSNHESFEKVIPVENLPDELGGKAGKIMDLHKAQIQKLESHRNWFLKMDEELKNSSNKAEFKKTVPVILGEEGNFRDIQID